ncbi:MAG TPA: hypothetical protein VL749_02705 [Patescibacteria group bacterium]|nr:hypothetical protein [Patescibacteria group bacterium]
MPEDRGSNGAAQPFATEAGAADAHLPPGPPPGPWRTLDRLVVAAFALALVVPGIMLALRVHVAQIENRPPRPFPALTINGLADTSWPAGVDGFLTDHLAPRPYAIRIRGELYWLSGGTGNPTVIRGLDNWLFIRDELQPACRFTAAQQGAALERAVAAFGRQGVEFRFLLIPDKHTIYPDKLKPDNPFVPTCADTQRADLDAAIAPVGGQAIDATTALEAARATPGTGDLYYSQDSHWTPVGASVAIGALARSLGADLWAPEDVVLRGMKRRVMDTAGLIGLRRVSSTPRVVIRPDVEQHRADVPVPVAVNNARAVFRITCTGSKPLLPGRTLVIYDSFFGIDTTLVAPYFADTTWVHVGDMLNHPELIRLLGPFDRVIVERVARGFYSTGLDTLLAPLLAQAGG